MVYLYLFPEWGTVLIQGQLCCVNLLEDFQNPLLIHWEITVQNLEIYMIDRRFVKVFNITQNALKRENVLVHS